MKYIKIFFVSNATVLATLLFLPALLFTNDIAAIDSLLNFMNKE